MSPINYLIKLANVEEKIGIVFLIGTAFIAFKPEPFLSYGYLGVFIRLVILGLGVALWK